MDIRYSLMATLEEANENTYGIQVMNSTSINWNNFAWDEGYIRHYISKFELLKPYLISYIYFGDIGYEYIILELNQIDDLDQIPIGTEIWIPKLTELETFIRNNTK
jgi:hypothetical protein